MKISSLLTALSFIVSSNAQNTWQPVLVQINGADNGWDTSVDVGEDEFNKLFAESGVIRRECPQCTATHQVVYYVRITDDCHLFNAYHMMKQFRDADNDGNGNILNTNFLLTNDESIAVGESVTSFAECNGNCWTTCNYNDDRVGGFRDCGPNGIVGGWMMYCTATSSCKSVRWSILELSSGQKAKVCDTLAPTADTTNPTKAPTSNPTLVSHPMNYFMTAMNGRFNCEVSQGVTSTIEECAQLCLDYGDGTECGGFERRISSNTCYIFPKERKYLSDSACPWYACNDCEMWDRVSYDVKKYTESWYGTTQQLIPSTDGGNSNGQECHGDCDSDGQCEGDLRCYFRDGNQPAPPKCKAGNGGMPYSTGWEICYQDPDEYSPYIGVAQNKNWQAAEDYCAATYGTSLASVHNDHENRVLSAICRQLGTSWCHIGLKDVNNDNVFTWTDGTEWDYSKWHPSYGRRGGVYCSIIRGSYESHWYDYNCGDSRYFICWADTKNPTGSPTLRPTISPTKNPTMITLNPTDDPTADPTIDPTTDPTSDPTIDPTVDPTNDPTIDPTIDPTNDPTSDPTDDPTSDPTNDPTVDPTADPTDDPTNDPTIDPTIDPTSDPTADPTVDPTSDPTDDPTADPTTDPTDDPTTDPTIDPTVDPTADPTNDPTEVPSVSPTQTGLNNAFGTTGGGGATILTSILIILMFIFGCALLVFCIYKRMNQNVQMITKQMTELVEERERQKSVQSAQSPDMSIDIGASGIGNADCNNAGTPIGMAEGDKDLTVPHAGTKMGHVASDESMIMSDMMN